MNRNDLEALEKEFRPLLKIAGLIRVLVAMSFTCVLGIVAGALWVANQTNAIAANSADVRSIIDDRKASLKEWMDWRRSKDENDTKFAVLLENQQEIQRAQQRMIERLADRVKP